RRLSQVHEDEAVARISAEWHPRPARNVGQEKRRPEPVSRSERLHNSSWPTWSDFGGRGLLPRPAEEVDEVPRHDPGDVLAAVSAPFQDRGHLAEFGDRVEVARGLLLSEAAVEVGPQPAMRRVPRNLA